MASRAHKLTSFLFVAASLGAISATANDRFLPHSIQEIGTADRFIENAYFIPKARVVYVNFEAVRRDFPELKDYANHEIENWILNEFAYISPAQLILNGIRNSEIQVDLDRPKLTNRSYRDGRAFQIDGNLNGRTLGVVSLKGTGLSDSKNREKAEATRDYFLANESASHVVDRLRDQDHSDGIMTMGEAIAELTRQRAIQMLFDLHNLQNGTSYETSETYFIIDPAFDVLRSHGQKVPAALYGRQAQFGRRPDNEVRISDELYFDPFVQATLSGASIDFGNVTISHPSLIPFFSGEDVTFRTGDTQNSRAWALGHQVATQVRVGDREAIDRHLREMVSPIFDEWESLRSEFKEFYESTSQAKWESYLAARGAVTIEELFFLADGDAMGALYKFLDLRLEEEKRRLIFPRSSLPEQTAMHKTLGPILGHRLFQYFESLPRTLLLHWLDQDLPTLSLPGLSPETMSNPEKLRHFHSVFKKKFRTWVWSRGISDPELVERYNAMSKWNRCNQFLNGF